MKGDHIIEKLLKKEGVEWISCFPAQTLIEACSVEGIRPVLCRQERAGVNMADAYSRINNGNKIGVFTMQRGPGAENAFGGVAQAYADSAVRYVNGVLLSSFNINCTLPSRSPSLGSFSLTIHHIIYSPLYLC